MDTTTHGIEYPEGTDAITDYPVVAQTAAETIDALISGGWLPIPAVLTFGAADGHTFTATAPGDLTASIGVGMRIKLTHGAAVKYFVVTAIAFAAGTTTLTLYGGTDYALAAGAITLPYFSPFKAPVGFPTRSDKWTEILVDATDRIQGSPANGTWYNPGALSLAIPIGAWEVSYEATLLSSISGTFPLTEVTLSTANNTQSDRDFTSIAAYVNGGTSSETINTVRRTKLLVLAAKTTYYLNARLGAAGGSNMGFWGGSSGTTVIRAVCAYL